MKIHRYNTKIISKCQAFFALIFILQVIVKINVLINLKSAN